MNQRQILRNRVINWIQKIKYKLRTKDSMPIFNDLIILRLIAAQLPKQTLRDLIKQLKKLMLSLDCSQEQVSISGVLELLSSTKSNIPLLQDFLKCAGYQQTLSVLGS